MEISKEQKEAIEELEKYTKWENYGEKNLEKDIIIVLGLLKETQNKNETLEELLQGTLYEMYKYYRNLANSYQGNCISKEKVKDKIEELNKKEKEELKGMKGQDRYFVKQTYQNKQIILQELLDGRNTDVSGIGSED